MELGDACTPPKGSHAGDMIVPDEGSKTNAVRSRRHFVFAAATAALATSACKRERSGTVAVIPKTTAIDYWENLHAGAETEAAARRLHVVWNAPQSETNYGHQALMVEDFIRRHVDGIVLAPSHGSVLASAVRHAKSEGIPLVLVDSPVMVEPGEYAAYIGSEPERMGRLAAERVGEVLGGRGDISMIGVSPTVEPAVLRERAFTATIASRYPNIRIREAQYGLSDHVRSREISSDMLAANDLSAIFASDPFAVRGAFIALRAHNNRRVRLVGVAQEQDLLSYVERGLIDSLVVQDPYSMGRLAVQILGDLLRGDYRGPRRIETNVAIATSANLGTPAIRELVARRRTVGETAAATVRDDGQ